MLLGGGHAHVEVLRSFGMAPMPGVRLTLITKDVHTAYRCKLYKNGREKQARFSWKRVSIVWLSAPAFQRKVLS